MAGFTIGLLESREAAQQVRGALVEAGSDEASVVIFGGEAGDGIAQELVKRGFAAERARLYAEAVGRGGVLVAAEVEDADAALAVMNRFDVKEPEELLERGADQVERAQSIEEELRVGKEQTTSGKRLVSSVSEREVEKRLRLVEEVRVTRRQTTRQVQERVGLRREEIVVERDAAPHGPDRDPDA